MIMLPASEHASWARETCADRAARVGAFRTCMSHCTYPAGHVVDTIQPPCPKIQAGW